MVVSVRGCWLRWPVIIHILMVMAMHIHPDIRLGTRPDIPALPIRLPLLPRRIPLHILPLLREVAVALP